MNMYDMMCVYIYITTRNMLLWGDFIDIYRL